VLTAAAQELPPVDDILNKYIQALGGKAALEKTTSRVAKGTFETPTYGASGTHEQYAKQPNKSVIITNVDGYGIVSQGFDGNTGWSQSPEIGVQEVTGPRLARARRQAVFNRALQMKELFTKLAVTGKDKLGERPVYVVEAVPPEGAPEKMYFDAENGLLLRTDSEAEDHTGAAMVSKVLLEEYKEVDGVMEPHTVKSDSASLSVVIRFTEVKHNVEIDDAIFQKPGPAASGLDK
jgi:hypothetical protein